MIPRRSPETSDAYEVGLKGTALDNRLMVNLAVFHTDYDNYQANFFDTVANQVVTRLVNAGKVKTQGVELDASFQATRQLKFSAAAAYTKARVDHFNCPVGAAANCNIDGGRLPFTPDWKTYVRADYVIPLDNGLDVELSSDYSWQDSVQFSLTRTPTPCRALMASGTPVSPWPTTTTAGAWRCWARTWVTSPTRRCWPVVATISTGPCRVMTGVISAFSCARISDCASTARRQSMSRQMSLGPSHGHRAPCRRLASPDVPADPLDFASYRRTAQIAEAACFDALFVADSVAAASDALASRSARSVYFEPLTLLSALSMVTERIGLIATATTSYNEPYHVARKYASLDHLGRPCRLEPGDVRRRRRGRQLRPRCAYPHAERYARAREFQQVVQGLWDSWADDAFVRDKASGEFHRPQAVRSIDHAGAHFRVRGPLNVARSPQGRPVLVQAGSSEAGRELAAESAEVVFTAQPSLASAQAFYADLKRRLARYGRSDDDLKIMPGVFVVVGHSAAEAQAKYQQFQDLVDPVWGCLAWPHARQLRPVRLPAGRPAADAATD